MSFQIDLDPKECEDAYRPQEIAKPFVKWAGGKRQLLPQLLSAIPKQFGTYFEPMLGAGALFFALRPERAYLSDTNEQLIQTYLTVKDNVEELITDLQQHEFNEDYYYSIRNADRDRFFSNWSATAQSSRFIYLNRTCFNGLYRVNSKGYFNVPIGRYSNPTICDADNLRAVSSAIAHTTFGAHSFQEIESKVQSGDFVYFDPPYAPLNETSNFTQYTKDAFGEEMQKELRDFCILLDQKGVQFLLSNSSAPLIYDLYSQFAIREVAANRAINSKSSKRGQVTELLICNY